VTQDSATGGSPSPQPPAERISSIAALRSPGFRLLWFGGLFSGAAGTMQMAVNGWVMYEMTGSPLQLGLTGLFAALPILTFSLLGGAIADSVDRKRLLVVTQGIRLIPALLLAILASTDSLRPWHIYLVTLITSTSSIFDRPARQALVASLVPREHLTNAITLNSTVGQFYQIIGPTVAGVILGVASAGASYSLNFVLFVIAYLTIVLLKAPHVAARPGRGSLLSMMGEGLQFLRGQREIFTLLILDFFWNGFAVYKQMMPIFAKDVLEVGPVGNGLLLSGAAFGAFAASGAILLLGNVRKKGLVIMACIWLYSFGLIAFGLSPWFLLSLPLTVMLGIVDQTAATLRNAFILLVTPDELRGRMEAMRITFTAGSPAIGNLQGGIIASVIGAPYAVAMGGVILLVAVVIADRLVPSVKRAEV
jgi:MFS family permease